MSESYLFGAEADQIQETLFRASRLRQVVGGSRLIAEFGEQARKLAMDRGAKVLITGGGSFRAIFPTPQAAGAFGDELADCYREALGASLTFTDTDNAVQLQGDFRNESKRVFQAIQRLKHAERGQQATEQTPTTAFCQYSGTGLAAELVRRPRESRNDYVSSAVELMRRAGQSARDGGEESFLGKIAKYLPVNLPTVWPDGETRDGVEKIEALDPENRNVAYLLADGNGMGKLFEKCDSPEQLTELSEALDEAMREAVANPIADLFGRFNAARENANQETLDFLPALPLILAGDDAFVLLPGCYALDYARRFCLEFEGSMRRSLSESKTLEPLLPFAPTIGAAIVICKGSFPYRIAYQRGKVRLDEAKRLSKSLAQATKRSTEERLSAISFEVITGNELIQEGVQEGMFRPELRPYWGQEQLSAGASAYGISLVKLLRQRLEFKDTPGKRLAELRELYSPDALPAKRDELQKWEPRLDRLKGRMDATEPKSSQSVRWVLEALGDPGGIGSGYWREVRRTEAGDEEGFRANGLADLIEVWDYAQQLDKEMEDYQRETARDER